MTYGLSWMVHSHFDKVVKCCIQAFNIMDCFLIKWICVLIIHLSMLSPRRGIQGIVGHLIPFFNLGKLTKILGTRVGTFNFVCKEKRNQITSWQCRHLEIEHWCFDDKHLLSISNENNYLSHETSHLMDCVDFWFYVLLYGRNQALEL